MQKYPYEYKVVPNEFRKYVILRPKKNHQPVTDKMLLDLLAGKTLLVETNLPLAASRAEFNALYGFFNSRGMRLRMCLFDNVDEDIYRGLLMWAESFYKVYRCDRCKRIIGQVGETRPNRENCTSKISPLHFWRERADGFMGRTHREPSNRTKRKIA